MDFSKEFVLDELREHTSDCDAARNQHYYMENRYQKMSVILETVKSTSFLATIAIYVVIVSGFSQNSVITAISLVLSVLSTILEILSYMLRLSDKATEHWKSAQMYSELYRKCQFFCSDYANSSVDVWREKLKDISEELSRIALLSPGVSTNSYSKACANLSQKKYPVHKAIMNQRMLQLEDVIQKIKLAFNDSKIEIFIFGSYLTSMYSNDIDIAVIWHCDESFFEASEKMNLIESEYAINGVNLDITVITESDIIANRCTQFIKNISEGECYYKSLDVKKCLKDYDISLSDYSGMIHYFIDIIGKNMELKEEPSLIENMFYMYYHMLAYFVSKYDISWYGERSLLNEADVLAASKELYDDLGISSTQMRSIIQHARMTLDKKNRLYSSEISFDDIMNLKEYFLQDKDLIISCVDRIKNNK